MDAARIVPLRSVASTEVRIEGETVIVDHLTLVDGALATFVAERPADDRPALAERALKIGLVALQDAGVSVNVDVVRREFEALLARTVSVNEKAAATLDEVLRQNFADGEGRLPRTLERFLGDRGALRAFVSDLFDEGKRDSAIGRLRELMGSYFDGDASRLAQLLDPTRMGSPLHQFRSEISDGFSKLNERLAALEAAAAARGAERARSAAKGADFEELLGGLLGDIARGAGDLLEQTSDESGDRLRSKKGDFVLTVDPRLARGAEVRVVIEAKDRSMSARAIREELREARENRDAAVAMVVFTPGSAPAGIAPFHVVNGDVYCVVDPEAPEPAYLEAAMRLARLLALAMLRDAPVELDAAAISAALAGIREQLDAIRGMKMQLTSVGNATKALWAGLDGLRQGILARVSEAEAELRPAS
ncbi:MAG TPA: hypothetical protein VFK38_08070 [Candidatus Limnocylindrales bacterium]|nr:hypothetical protein [Candidatus Limnocylindrales bacterium]